MPALLCRQWNGHQTLGAVLRRRRGSRLVLHERLVHPLDDQEHGERDDTEVDNRVHEYAVIDPDGGARPCSFFESDPESAEIHAADNEAYWRQKNVADERADDLPEGRSDNNTDGHVDHISPH